MIEMGSAYGPSGSGMTITPAGTPEAQRDQLVDLVCDRTRHSQTYYRGVYARLPQHYDLWRGIYAGNFASHKNNVHLPLVYTMTVSAMARTVLFSLGQNPIIRFIGFAPEDAPIARKREALIQAQWEDAGVFAKEVVTNLHAQIYGVAVSQVSWQRTVEDRLLMLPEVDPQTGQATQSLTQRQVTSFDGPQWETVDPRLFYPQPGFREIDKMQWVVRRMTLDIEDIRDLAAQGMFDPAEVQRLEREGGTMPLDDTFVPQRADAFLGQQQGDARQREPLARPVEILEMWGMVPRELCPDGARSRVLTVANRQFLLRNVANPFWHGKKPFVAFSFSPDPHYFFAPGIAETTGKMQVVANKKVNQGLDVTDLCIDPVMFYNKSAGLDVRNLVMRPGRFFGVEGDPKQAVMPLQMDLRGLAYASADIERMWTMMQRATGLSADAAMGLDDGGSDRQTAREFMGRKELASMRLALGARLYEEMYLEPLADLCVQMNRQFLPTPKEVMILGQSAVVDPVTGYPIDTQRETIAAQDLLPDYAGRANGASTAMSRATRVQNMTGALPILANPLVAPYLNWLALLRTYLTDMEYPNVNELVQMTPAVQAVVQQQMMGAGNGGGPGGNGASRPPGIGTDGGRAPIPSGSPTLGLQPALAGKA